MLSINEQKYLINTARANYNRSLRAIVASDYYHLAFSKEAKDGNFADLMKEDINRFSIILNAPDLESAWSEYTDLDTAARDGFIDALKTEFCYIDSDELTELSDIILNYREYLRTTTAHFPASVCQAVDKELNRLNELNTMVCDYAKRVED